MYQDGLLLDLAWTRNKSFRIMAKARLEKVAEQPYHGFFPMYTDDHLNLFFGNNSKSGVLYNQYLKPTLIPNSTMPKQFCRDASMVQVGKVFWVLGGSYPCVSGEYLNSISTYPQFTFCSFQRWDYGLIQYLCWLDQVPLNYGPWSRKNGY